jgi:hypothetical protein
LQRRDFVRGIGVIVGLLMLAAAAPVAVAEPLPDGGITAQEMTDILEKEHFAITMAKDQNGDPLIKTQLDDLDWSVYFFECRNNRCGSIQFAAGFRKKVPAAQTMEWNKAKRFGRAYLNPDGGPWVEMDMDLEHGANTEAMSNNIERWKLTLREFNKLITTGKVPKASQ